jgi:hypothetical protein
VLRQIHGTGVWHPLSHPRPVRRERTSGRASCRVDALTTAAMPPRSDDGTAGRPARRPDRQPVGGQPVGQSSCEGRTAGHAREDEQAGEAGFHDAEAARRQRDEGDDAGRRIGQQRKRWLRMSASCAQGPERAAEVDSEPARHSRGRSRAPGSPSAVRDQRLAVTAGSRPLVTEGPVLDIASTPCTKGPRAAEFSRLRRAGVVTTGR